jgi:multiple sugar transport system permease protein
MAVTGRRGRIGQALALGLGVLLTLGPIYWLFVIAVKSPNELLASQPTAYPHHPTFSNFSALFTDYGFGHFVVNSAIVVTISVAIALPIGGLAAYVLGRLRLVRGANETLSFGILAIRILPGIVIIVPIYLMIVSLNWFDSYQGLVAVYTAFNLPFVIWMMESFIREVPVELEEAAMTDGSSRVRAVRTVVLPLLRPGIAATAIMSVIFTYNDFLFALVLTASPNAQTVNVGAAAFFGKGGADIGQLAAAGVIGLAPIVIFVLFAQRHLVRGLTMGAFR